MEAGYIYFTFPCSSSWSYAELQCPLWPEHPGNMGQFPVRKIQLGSLNIKNIIPINTTLIWCNTECTGLLNTCGGECSSNKAHRDVHCTVIVLHESSNNFLWKITVHISKIISSLVKKATSWSYLLVEDHKAFVVISTHCILELDYLLHALLNELPLSSHQLLPLASTLVEEARVHLTESKAGVWTDSLEIHALFTGHYWESIQHRRSHYNPLYCSSYVL